MTLIPLLFYIDRRKEKKPGRKMGFGSEIQGLLLWLMTRNYGRAQRKLSGNLCGETIIPLLTLPPPVLYILLSRPMPGTLCNESPENIQILEEGVIKPLNYLPPPSIILLTIKIKTMVANIY